LLKGERRKMKIRDANLEDLLKIENIISEHWKVNIDHQKELENPNAILLVAEDEADSRILGTALMWVTDWNKTGYLVELAVENTMKRKGIGSKILEELLSIGKRHDLRSIIVETQMGRHEAIGFYLSRNFRMCGYNDRYYTNHPDSGNDIAIFFSLDIV
jgi:[ribosomal protein S18]-alanine N-acetyltransferase